MDDRAAYAAMAARRPASSDGIIVDPAVPAVRDFLLGAIMDGLIRTVPAGRRRVLILPSAAPAPPGSRPVAGTDSTAWKPIDARPVAAPMAWSLAEIQGRIARLAAETTEIAAMSVEVRMRCAEIRHRLRAD